ncbi:MAG: transposase, partial [Gammaproteobacteria bacterium]
TLIQRFGGALNLNIHFHLLVLDGVYLRRPGDGVRFVRVPTPTAGELQCVIERIAQRVGRHLERRGLLVRDAENAYLDWYSEQTDAMDELAGHSITYRVAVGPNQGQKAYTLQTLPAISPDDNAPGELANAAGFSLHAGVSIRAGDRDKLERLCRYVARAAVADSRLSLTRDGQVRYSLKTPWRDGTTHVVFEPLDFIARLAALIPRPGVNLTRYHGVFAPNSRARAQVTPARRGKRPARDSVAKPRDRHDLTWAERLKRVFRIDVEVCQHCGGAVRIIACIVRPVIIDRILRHLRRTRRPTRRQRPQVSRAPP